MKRIVTILALMVFCITVFSSLCYGQQKPLTVIAIRGNVIVLSNGAQYVVQASSTIPLRYWRLGMPVYFSRVHYHLNQYGYTLSTPNAQLIFVVALPNTSQIQLQNYLYSKANRQRDWMQNMMFLYFMMKQNQQQNQYCNPPVTPQKKEAIKVVKVDKTATVTARSSWLWEDGKTIVSSEKQRIYLACDDDGKSFWVIVYARLNDRPTLNQKVILKQIGNKTYISFIRDNKNYLLRYDKD